MSENQYDPKFITAAKMKPIIRPCAPPSASPISSSRRAHRAEQKRCLQSVRHISYSSSTHQNPRATLIIPGCSLLRCSWRCLLNSRRCRSRFPARRRRLGRRSQPRRSRRSPPRRRRRHRPAPRPRSPTINLGVALYPGSQYLGAFDAGRGQKFYLYGTSASFVGDRRVLSRAPEGTRRPRVRRPGDARVRHRALSRGHDGVPAERHDQGFSVRGVAGVSESKARRDAGEFPTIIQIVPVPGAER